MVISSSSKDKWSEGYSRLNFISSLGYLIGDLAAAALSSILSIRLIILLMGLLPTASTAWLMLTMPSEGKVTRRSGGYRQIKRVVNTGDLAYVFTLYTALIVFYVSSGIFNTLYPYGLRKGGLSKTWMTPSPPCWAGFPPWGSLGVSAVTPPIAGLLNNPVGLVFS